MSEPGQAMVPAPNTNNPKTHCPACHLPEIRYAHGHCPNKKDGRFGCNWRRCKCGVIWDTISGRWNQPVKG